MCGVLNQAESIERVVGHKPPTCLFRLLREPYVQECIRAYRAFETGNLAAVFPSDPAAELVDGVMVLNDAVNATREEQRKARERERKR